MPGIVAAQHPNVTTLAHLVLPSLSFFSVGQQSIGARGDESSMNLK
jgi:hypothetical protein